jgi:hypothetical protein
LPDSIQFQTNKNLYPHLFTWELNLFVWLVNLFLNLMLSCAYILFTTLIVFTLWSICFISIIIMNRNFGLLIVIFFLWWGICDLISILLFREKFLIASFGFVKSLESPHNKTVSGNRLKNKVESIVNEND